MITKEQVANLKQAFAEHDIPWPRRNVQMNRFQIVAERLTSALGDASWHPLRAHIEGARNELVKAGAVHDEMLSALNAVLNWYTPPNDSGPFPAEQVAKAVDSARTVSAP